MNAALANLYYYQNPNTKQASSSAVSVKQLCRIICRKTSESASSSSSKPTFIDGSTSIIAYDKQAKHWVRYDKKNNMSVATSASPYASLLIGVHVVDFRGVVDDACQENGIVRKLKFTTCIPGQFTCNDGQCVGIEKRCDQTTHCKDQSDEENCHIIQMKSSYNEKIAPFSYSQEERK